MVFDAKVGREKGKGWLPVGEVEELRSRMRARKRRALGRDLFLFSVCAIAAVVALVVLMNEAARAVHAWKG